LGGKSQVSVIRRTEKDWARWSTGDMACFARPVALKRIIVVLIARLNKKN
jgi:hypothetical protein